MNNLKKTVCQYRQQLAWEQPYPATNQVGRYLEKEVANLPNSETEDARGFSMYPGYSDKQLRRINRLHRRNHREPHGEIDAIQLPARRKTDSRYKVVKRASLEEDIL
jgi:hypothetical protein